ncbi:MAG: TniB family NTP-binding protein [Candidatus Helarchaeota archaeon]
MDFDHLNKETAELLRRISTISSEKRKRSFKEHWIVKEWHFVYHEKAKNCIQQLNYIYRQTIETPRDGLFEMVFNGLTDDAADERTLRDWEGMMIVGEGGTGKTSIVQQFIRLKKQKPDAVFEHYPVQYAVLKTSIAGLKGLYSALLEPFNSAYANPEAVKRKQVSFDEMEKALIHHLKVTRTRLMFVDDLQHSRLGRFRQAIIDQLKWAMVMSQVPFVFVGTPDVEFILSQDPQLGERCPVKTYSRLEWFRYPEGDEKPENKEYRREFRGFIRRYEEFLPFEEASMLYEAEIAKLIFDKIKYGNPKYPDDKNIENPTQPRPDEASSMRRLVNYLKKLAVTAVWKKQNKITRRLILETPP